MKWRGSFRPKTCLHTWKDHRCYGYKINRAFVRERLKILQKKSEMVLYFIGAAIVNRTLHECLEIRNFSSKVENISLLRCAYWKYFSLNTRRGISYLRGATYYPLSLTSGCLAALWGWLVPFAFPQTLAWLPYKKKSNWFKIRFSLDSVHKKRHYVEIQCCAHATPPNWNMSAVTRAKIICLFRHW